MALAIISRSRRLLSLPRLQHINAMMRHSLPPSAVGHSPCRHQPTITLRGIASHHFLASKLLGEQTPKAPIFRSVCPTMHEPYDSPCACHLESIGPRPCWRSTASTNHASITLPIPICRPRKFHMDLVWHTALMSVHRALPPSQHRPDCLCHSTSRWPRL